MSENKKLAPYGPAPKRPVNKGYGDAGVTSASSTILVFAVIYADFM